MLGSYNKSTKNRHVVKKVDFEDKKINQEGQKRWFLCLKI